MGANLSEFFNLAFRWIHVVAAVMWLGQLWFLTFVNVQAVRAYDEATRRHAVPELLPRVLYFFRFGAAFTWISGFFLLGIVYYGGGAVADAGQSLTLARWGGLLSLFVTWIVYDQVWMRLGHNRAVAMSVSLVVLVALAFGLAQIMSGRSLFVHLGAALATVMLGNVWRHIWPSQQRIVKAIKAGVTPDVDAVQLATLRSVHNTYLSVPVLFFMISNHFPVAYGSGSRPLVALGIIAVGWLMAKALFARSTSPAAMRI
ncbi:MAG TPA: urate hydroxylase PuuD [Vicinamibacterales bacterium]|nr:urate hydroxylase PuuD [Vicinamibacterales bacterium]